jgi:hypothetical protein
MTNGPQAITSRRIALAFETAGARAAAPTVYIIAGGKITPTVDKKNEFITPDGMRDAAFVVRGAETTKLSIPMMALVDNNGLGELLLGTFGTDTQAQKGSTAAYDHVFTANDTIKTMTGWCWDTLNPQDIRMVAVDTLKIEINKETNRVDFTFDLVGADMMDSSTFGSASYINVDTERPNLIPASQAILEYGEPLANVRSAWEKIVFTSKEAPVFGAPGKGAPIPAGSSSPKQVVKGPRTTTIDIDLIDLDNIERRRCREGGNITPTATAEADTAASVAFRCKVFGSSIAAGLNAYADLNNTATVAVANLAVYSTAQGSNKDITFTAKTPGIIPTITYAVGTALAVSVLGVAITVTLDDSPAPTADDIIAAIQASSAASLLVTVARKTGQNGTGTPSDFTVQPLVAAASGTTVTVSGSYTGADVAMLKVWIDANGSPDTLSWQLNGGAITTGVAITGSAQVITAGISLAFSSTTGGTVGDTFYVFTHWQRMIEFSSLTNALEPFKQGDSSDFYRGTVSMSYVGGPSSTKPSVTIRSTRTTAYA